MRHISITIILLLLQMSVASATPQDDVNEILALDQAPFGVVFEVVEGDDDALPDYNIDP